MERTVLLKETEQEPSARPIPLGLSEAAAGLDPGAVWRRLEQWICWRWGERPVEWIVEGPGAFTPRLRPATIGTIEQWGDAGWEPAEAEPRPTGLYLPEGCTYRITASAGTADPAPADVQEAFVRLSEYLAATKADGALGAHEVSDGDYTIRRPAAWAARAMQYSGAADLLRPYR